MNRGKLPNDTVDAFVRPVDVPHANDGPLAGLTFGAKDLYDIAGYPTGFGNPTWEATHAVPQTTAPSIQRLLDQGARLVGKTHTDELAYSLAGRNIHYGAPVNVNAPGRTTGGSSSGSVAATAAGLVDFAVGSDTGGSVRIPASLCGVYGIRTTQDRISMDGAAPLAASFDTFGWFARDPDVMEQVAGAVFCESGAPLVPANVWIPADVLCVLEGRVRPKLISAGKEVARVLGATVVDDPIAEAAQLADWAEVFRIHQAYEAWHAHGAWIQEYQPDMAPDVAERFRVAASISEFEYQDALSRRRVIQGRVIERLAEDTVLVIPAAPDVALPENASAEAVQAFRTRAFQLNCIAGLAGLPQVVKPGLPIGGLPLGVSLVGAPRQDEALLALSRRLLGGAQGLARVAR